MSDRLSLEEQKENFRHTEDLSQRFLRLVLAALALIFVFARPTWVDYLLAVSPPETGLTARQASGAFIGNLTATMVANNGNILRVMAVLGISAFFLSAFWAALVLFLREPDIFVQSRSAAAASYYSITTCAKTYLRRAYLYFGGGILLLAFAGFGFWSFYISGGIWILIFDSLTLIGTIVMAVFMILHADSLISKVSIPKAAKLTVSTAEFFAQASTVLLLLVYFRYVYFNAMTALVLWLRLTGVL